MSAPTKGQILGEELRQECQRPKCEWTFYKGPFPKCEKPADFVKRTERRGDLWHLCREHCEGLINSCNAKTQLTERPLWRPV